ncbi:MAG: hypothetical protein GEV06_03900 [Luteitalea sp.]|nr:hypothetical protein [Luteitalea sp.]
MIITGAPGSEEHRGQQRKWREALVKALGERHGMPSERIIALSADAPEAEMRSTRTAVRRVLGDLASRVSATDVLLIVLMGHSSFDGVDAKFNLVGPDLEAHEWNRLLAPIAGRIVFVNTTGASSPFLARLAGRNRVIIAATHTPAQKYDTVFPEFWVEALGNAGTDLDRNGRISIWEAFARASSGVRRWYDQQGQLATERAVLDDTNDGTGRDVATEGEDGLLASRTFLDAEPAMASGDPTVAVLVSRRDQLELELDELKRKRSFMPPGDYEQELERVLIDIARVSREIRRKAKS